LRPPEVNASGARRRESLPLAERVARRMAACGVAATAEDYAWVPGFHNRLMTVGYCLTLVEGIDAHEAGARLGAASTGERVGLDALADRSHDIQTESGFRRLAVGITATEGWALLLLEINGWLGVYPTSTLSSGCSLVSHYRNVNADGRFAWWHDGELVLGFDPLFPTDREGSRAETCGPQLTSAGFDLEPRDSFDAPMRFDPLASAFALCHAITGTGVTGEVLDSTTYELVIAPVPR
jgi:hypothetical protein